MRPEAVSKARATAPKAADIIHMDEMRTGRDSKIEAADFTAATP